MPLLQKLRQIGNRGPTLTRVTRDPEKQLVLLGCHTSGSRRALAKTKEQAQTITKLGQLNKQAACEFLRSLHRDLMTIP